MFIRRVTIETTLPPYDVRYRIWDLIGPNEGFSYFRNYSWLAIHPLHGTVRGDTFWLGHTYAKAASPVVRGQICAVSTGSVVDIRITPNPVIMAIISLQLLFVLVALSPAPPNREFKVVICCFIAAFSVIGSIAYLYYAHKMEQLIRAAILPPTPAQDTLSSKGDGSTDR